MRVGIAVLALLLVGAARAGGQEAPPLPADRPFAWNLAAGYGFSLKVNRGRSEEQLFLFEPGVAFRLSARFEWVVEAHLARYFRPTGTMFGISPLGVRFYLGNGRLLPYVSLGAGCGWTDLTQLDEIDRRFNFLIQGSAGVRGVLGGGQAWTLEARLAHISNAWTAEPNLGLNDLVFLAGWRF